MKNNVWNVKLLNPINLNETIWEFTAETIEKVSLEWIDTMGNNFINYQKLHNIYHKRNKSNALLIKITKINKNE
tara:strand:- start:234 stop:455 length:222 start_codon:yes stop_codon:yes gene_type:complete